MNYTIRISFVRTHILCQNKMDIVRPIEKNPHHKLWVQILSFFRRHGFIVTHDNKDKIISASFKYGRKNNLEFHTHVYPNGFEMEFFQNVVYQNPSGGRYDFDKLEKMPYLIRLSYYNEMNRLIKFLDKKGISMEIERKMSDVDLFMKSKYSSAHFPYIITSLDQIQPFMKLHDLGRHSTDRDGNTIKCGDVKYMYHHKRKLVRGEVYHSFGQNWAFFMNGKMYSVHHADLFDYVPGMPICKPLSREAQIQRLHTELKLAESAMNYERCIVLRNLLAKYKLYNIWSIKHGCWWGPNDAGYTKDKNHAGVYTDESVTTKMHYYNDGVNTIAKPVLN